MKTASLFRVLTMVAYTIVAIAPLFCAIITHDRFTAFVNGFVGVITTAMAANLWWCEVKRRKKRKKRKVDVK
ncbi:MAG: hypothetical protein WCT40_04820 [Candidatus Magasanikbacteria bacterium]